MTKGLRDWERQRPTCWDGDDDYMQASTREVFEACQRKSKLLGPDGKRLVYPRQKLGFDLRRRET